MRKLIEEYLKGAEIMQLATVNDGQPWICTVNYALDENLNFYWMSMRATRHSQELKKDPKTAAAILVDSKEKKCIHIEGSSYEVTADDADSANKIYAARYGDKPDRLKEAKSGDEEVRAYYVFKPNKIVLFDLTSDTERQELDI